MVNFGGRSRRYEYLKSEHLYQVPFEGLIVANSLRSFLTCKNMGENDSHGDAGANQGDYGEVCARPELSHEACSNPSLSHQLKPFWIVQQLVSLW